MASPFDLTNEETILLGLLIWFGLWIIAIAIFWAIGAGMFRQRRIADALEALVKATEALTQVQASAASLAANRENYEPRSLSDPPPSLRIRNEPEHQE
jgi:hypothetical protein